jgi:hypothetical protein
MAGDGLVSSLFAASAADVQKAERPLMLLGLHSQLVLLLLTVTYTALQAIMLPYSIAKQGLGPTLPTSVRYLATWTGRIDVLSPDWNDSSRGWGHQWCQSMLPGTSMMCRTVTPPQSGTCWQHGLGHHLGQPA